MKRIGYLTLIGAGLLSACAPTQTGINAPVIMDAAIRSEVDQQIAQNGAEAAAALRQLAAIQRVRTPAPSPAVSDSDLPAELRTKATFEWSGPAVGLVRELAGRVGYSFRETGNPPPVPAIVNVSLRETSVGQALADVGLQAQRTSTVIVDPNTRSIEFRHEAAAGYRMHRASVASSGAAPRRATAHRVSSTGRPDK